MDGDSVIDYSSDSSTGVHSNYHAYHIMFDVNNHTYSYDIRSKKNKSYILSS